MNDKCILNAKTEQERKARQKRYLILFQKIRKATKILCTPDKADDILDEDMLRQIEKHMNQDIIEAVQLIHPYTISMYTEKSKGRKPRDRWTTHVKIDENSPKLRKVARDTEAEIYAFLVDYYGICKEEPQKIYTTDDPDPTSMAGLYHRWFAEEATTDAATTGTLGKKASCWQNVLRDEGIMQRSLKSVSVDEWFSWKKQTKGRLSSSYWKNVNTVLLDLERFAIEKKVIPRCTYSSTPALPRSCGQKKRSKTAEQDTFSVEEVQRFQEACWTLFDKRHTPAYLVLSVACQMGCRVGELAAIQEKDVDLVHHRIHLCHQIVTTFYSDLDDLCGHVLATVIKDELKAGHPDRYVSLTPEVEKMCVYFLRLKEDIRQRIQDAKAQGKATSLRDNSFLFVHRNGTPASRQSFQRAIRRAYDMLGWTGKKTTGVHQTRRTFATAATKVLSIKDVSTAIGHKDVSTTEAYYDIAASIPPESRGAQIGAIFNVGTNGDKKNAPWDEEKSPETLENTGIQMGA